MPGQRVAQARQALARFEGVGALAPPARAGFSLRGQAWPQRGGGKPPLYFICYEIS